MSERKIGYVTKAYDKLLQHKERLEQEKESIDGLPSVAEVQTKQVKLQTALDDINTKLNKLSTKSFSAQIDTINTKIRDASKRFDIVAKQAASLKFMDNDSSNWDNLNKFVKEQDNINKEQAEKLHQQITMLKQQEAELQNRLDVSLSKRQTKNNKEITNSIKSQLTDTKHELARVMDQMNILRVNTALVGNYKKSISGALKSKGSDYNSWAKGRDDLKRNTNWQVAQQSRLETFAIDKNQKVIPDSVIQDLQQQKENIKSQLLEIKQARRDALKNDTKKQNLSEQIENTNAHINNVNTELANVNKETENWKARLKEIEGEIDYINQQMAILIEDTKKNPTEKILKSDAMQSMNKPIDEANRKWGALGNTMTRLQTRMAGIKGYMRQTTMLTRIWHKVWQNIYSQIASLINPLNVVRRLWNGWINQWDNRDWKNTFDVISYNFAKAAAPLMEKIATAMLKIAAAANVFIKRWTGVDLFDKTAWQAEKLKKNVGQLTASFDELHASSENPNEFNTVFDTGKVDMDSLLSPEWEKTLTEWADNIANAFKKIGEIWNNVWNWVKEHPILAAIGAITLAALLSKLGIGGLLGALGKLIFKGALGIAKLAWKGLTWLGPKLLSGVKWIGSKLFSGNTWKSAWTGIKGIGSKIGGFFSKGLYTGMNGATVTMGKFLGGIGLVAGGVTLAGTQAAKAGKHWQEYNGWQKAGAVGAVGLGSAMAGVGAVMLGASGPVGWAVAGAVALGSLVIGMSQTQNGIDDLETETKEWQQANENLQKSMENVQIANQNYTTSLANVKQLEEQTGKSGEELANAVDSGKISIEQLTSAEINLYNAYKESRKKLEELQEARKQEFKDVKEEAKQKGEMLIANGKETKSFDELEEHIINCWKNGSMSAEEAKDMINKALVDMDLQSRITFIQKLPANLREGLDPSKYESGMNKLGTWLNDKFNSFGDGIKSIFGIATNELENFASTTEELQEAEQNLANAHNDVETKTTALNDAEQKAGITFDDLMRKIQDGEIEYGKLTEAQKAVVDAHNNLETAQAEQRESLRLTGQAVAGVAYQSYKSSGDYKTFINTMKKANEDGKISTEDMNKYFGEVMSDMNTSQRTMFTDYMKELGLSTKESEQFCKQTEGLFQSWVNGIKGFFSDLWNNIGGFFSRAGQRFGNLFSGKGFKTDEQIQNEQALKDAGEERLKKVAEEHPEDLMDVLLGKKNINSLAVGTNYVPNDQLAYIHQGEAVIPKKYNKGYVPPSDNGMSSTISSMVREIGELRQLIQQGIPVTGEFRQRGSDLVATVNKASNKNGSQALSNPAYAR